MLPFFIAGILCSKYEWQKYLGTYWFLFIITILFTLCNLKGLLPESMKAETAMVGSLFSMSLCLIIAKSLPRLFGSFRDHTFQIFLMGIFFQMAIRWIYVKWGNDTLFVPMWLMSVLIGVYAPTIIARFIEKYAPKVVKMGVGL